MITDKKKHRNASSPEPDSASSSGSGHLSGSPDPDQILQNVLENVLRFLTSRRDRNAASLVCRLWYRVEAVTRPDLFIGNSYAVSPARVTTRFTGIKSITLKGRPRPAGSIFVPRFWGAQFSPWALAISKAYPYLQKLRLKRMSVSNDNLTLLAKSFPSIHELALVSCDGFSTDGLASIASQCRLSPATAIPPFKPNFMFSRQIKVLDLDGSRLLHENCDWISSFPESETALESFTFDCVDGFINFKALESLVARSPSLKKLRLNRRVSFGQLHRLILRAPQLTDLGTGSFCSDDPNFHEIQEPDYASAFTACKSLVSLSGFFDIEPNYLPFIYPLSCNLTSLDFSEGSITAEQLNPIIANCHKLQSFRVLAEIEDEGLEMVAASCKELRDLRVLHSNRQPFVSEIGLLAISEGCKKLRSIHYFCSRMTNSALVTLSRNCPELVEFRLFVEVDYAKGLPMDEGLGAIVKNCKKLTSLAVRGLFTDKVFEYIGKYGKQIRTLRVWFAGKSDNGLRYVLEACPKLQKLEIESDLYREVFGDVALVAGLHRYSNMRFMWVSKCRMSLYACQQIALALPKLVVEVSESERYEGFVQTLYAYRSLDGPRTDTPSYVSIL